MKTEQAISGTIAATTYKVMEPHLFTFHLIWTGHTVVRLRADESDEL